MKAIFFLIPAVLLLSACKKDNVDIMKEARAEIAGRYDILRVDVTTYDISGNIVTSNSYTDAGVIELTLNSSGIQNENWIDFPAELFDYTTAFGKLKDSRFFYWDTDPEKKRFMIWGITNEGYSVHSTFTELITNGFSLTYTESNDAAGPLENTMARKEFYMLKKR